MHPSTQQICCKCSNLWEEKLLNRWKNTFNETIVYQNQRLFCWHVPRIYRQKRNNSKRKRHRHLPGSLEDSNLFKIVQSAFHRSRLRITCTLFCFYFKALKHSNWNGSDQKYHQFLRALFFKRIMYSLNIQRSVKTLIHSFYTIPCILQCSCWNRFCTRG